MVVFIKRPELLSFALARLIEVVEKPMKDLTKEDKEGHEATGLDSEMYETYTKFYNRPVGPDTPVKIARFEILAMF